MEGIKLKKFVRDYLTLSLALQNAAARANMDKVPYYIYKGLKTIKLANYQNEKLKEDGAEEIVVHPFEPSEMWNKENNQGK